MKGSKELLMFIIVFLVRTIVKAIEKEATIISWLVCMFLVIVFDIAFKEAGKASKKIAEFDQEIEYCYNEAQANDDAQRQRLAK